jgi:hypothetical protein
MLMDRKYRSYSEALPWFITSNINTHTRTHAILTRSYALHSCQHKICNLTYVLLQEWFFFWKKTTL